MLCRSVICLLIIQLAFLKPSEDVRLSLIIICPGILCVNTAREMVYFIYRRLNVLSLNVQTMGIIFERNCNKGRNPSVNCYGGEALQINYIGWPSNKVKSSTPAISASIFVYFLRSTCKASSSFLKS